SLLVDESVFFVPWELCYTGDSFLATKFSLGRQALKHSDPKPLRTRAADAPLTVLIIADPTEDLPAAEREADYLYAELRNQPAMRVTVWWGKGVQKAPLLSRLADYDIVHFAGHSVFNSEQPARSGWQLAEGLVTAGELSQLDSCPRLVFSNSCLAGVTAET